MPDTMTAEPLTLTHGPFTLVLLPALGGAVASFTVDGRDVLRPATPQAIAATDPLATAGFPMVPFCGRIHDGRFSRPNPMDLHPVQLGANLLPEPHCIHGFGWRTGWRADEVSPASVRLVHETVEGQHGWPWSYRAEQSFTLSNEGLTVGLRLTNRSALPMPAGFGWHPYFWREGAQLQAATTHVWETGEDKTNGRPVPVRPGFDLTGNPAVASLDLDHCFDVAEAGAVMTWPDMAVRFRADPIFTKLVVYVPPGQDFFCVEPISHSPDSVNSPLDADATGYREIGPGDTLAAEMALDVTLG